MKTTVASVWPNAKAEVLTGGTKSQRFKTLYLLS